MGLLEFAMGRALLGRRPGEEVRFRAPAGALSVKVLDVRSPEVRC